MKVGIFIDGKNFYKGYQRCALHRRVDYPGMAAWLVEQVGGSFLWGVSYYTGIETGSGEGTEAQAGLRRFLDNIEVLPGFFVHRFPRKSAYSRCPNCQSRIRYSREKEVDTTMVADMLRLAAVGAFDILVLASGDADHAPAVEGVRSLGKQAYVATWGGLGLSARTRRAAFDHIDLSSGVSVFAPESMASEPESAEQYEAGWPQQGGALQQQRGQERESVVNPDAQPSDSPSGRDPEVTADEEFINELQRAEREFINGYVGARFFLTRWISQRLSPSAAIRGRILDRLIEKGRVTAYIAGDGARAIRVLRDDNDD